MWVHFGATVGSGAKSEAIKMCAWVFVQSLQFGFRFRLSYDAGVESRALLLLGCPFLSTACHKGTGLALLNGTCTHTLVTILSSSFRKISKMFQIPVQNLDNIRKVRKRVKGILVDIGLDSCKELLKVGDG